MTDKTFDLFAFLGKLNKRNLEAYDNLSDEDKKAAHPFVIMRWLTGTSDQAQIVRINTFANRYMFSLGQEKELLFKLLAASCTGKTNRTKWIKGPGSGSTKLSVQIIKDRYNCSTREAEQYIDLLNAEDLLLFAEEVGWDKEQIKKLQVELSK